MMSDPLGNIAPQNGDALHFAADIVSAYVSNNRIAAQDIPGLIQTVHAALDTLAAGGMAGLDGSGKAVGFQDQLISQCAVGVLPPVGEQR